MRSGSTASSVQTITQQRGEAAQLGRIKEGEAGRWRGWGGVPLNAKYARIRPPHPPPSPPHAMTAAPAASLHDPEESLTFHGRHGGASTGAHQNFIPQLCWPTLDVVRGMGGLGGVGGGPTPEESLQAEARTAGGGRTKSITGRLSTGVPGFLKK